MRRVSGAMFTCFLGTVVGNFARLRHWKPGET